MNIKENLEEIRRLNSDTELSLPKVERTLFAILSSMEDHEQRTAFNREGMPAVEKAAELVVDVLGEEQIRMLLGFMRPTKKIFGVALTRLWKISKHQRAEMFSDLIESFKERECELDEDRIEAIHDYFHGKTGRTLDV